MIKTIKLSNFKCFKGEKTINLSDLTLISGLNNSGKSTIYQILLLLKQSQSKYLQRISLNTPSLQLNGAILQLGNPEEILNDINNNDKVSIIIDFEESVKLTLVYKLVADKKERLKSFLVLDVVELADMSNVQRIRSYKFERRDNQYYIKANNVLMFTDFELGQIIGDYIRSKVNRNHTLLDLFSTNVEFNHIINVNFMDFNVMDFELDMCCIKECLNKKYKKFFLADDFNKYLVKRGYSEKTFSLVCSTEQTIARLIKTFLDKIIVIPPYRGDPKRVYVETEYQNPLLISTRDTNKKIVFRYDKNRKIRGTLNASLKYWIPKIITDIDSFKVNVLVEGLVSETIIEANSKKIYISNVGFGISQILPLILNVLLMEENTICIIDEPEVHLHPALQSKMADFFIEMIKLKKKIIIETHSEYIINRVLYHKLLNRNQNISMLWVNNNGSDSKIEQIKCDSSGYIVNKPKGFLDENENIIQQINNERLKRL